RRAYFGRISRFVSVHRQKFGASGANLKRIVENGPGLEHDNLTATIEALAADGQPARAFTADQQNGGPIFGMCGILHQIKGFAAV
ncbi:MAG: hypothetical protein GXP01_06125, partial [Alphaproteobacteria bacterium]|nr:hypothetical protein [Alphaproteobacteria bacterium]